jgi:hypothetical protein
MKEFFLKGKKYKLFLGFHLFVVGIYSLYLINTVMSCNSLSYSKYNKESVFENILKYSLYIIVNLIAGVIIFCKLKYTRIILNFFAVVILILVCFANYTLIKSYINNSYYNFVIIFNTLVIGFVLFYIFYLNHIEIEKNEIENIGKHED